MGSARSRALREALALWEGGRGEEGHQWNAREELVAALRLDSTPEDGGGSRWPPTGHRCCSSPLPPSHSASASLSARERALPGSRFQAVHHSRKRDRFSQVRQAANPRQRALEAQSKTRVHEGAVAPEVQVPAVGI